METFVSYAPGTCAACGGKIKKGDTCKWGKERGQRLHASCPSQERPERRPFSPSEDQVRLFGFLTESDRSGIVNAVAGSGKTTSIVEGSYRVGPGKSQKYFVFNKRNSVEAREKMPEFVDVSTFHATGYAALCNRFGKVEINGYKLSNILRDLVEDGSVTTREAEDFGGEAIKLCQLAKRVGIGVLAPDVDEEWQSVIDHHDIDFETDVESDYDEAARGLEIARMLLRVSKSREDVFDFDDELYEVLRLRIPLRRYDIVYVDEAQDTSPVRRAFVRLSLNPGGRVIAVGDYRQAIYGFTGADNDSIEQIEREFNTVSLGLSTNYRSSRAVIAAAQVYCPEITACDTAPLGSVTLADEFRMGDFRPTDAILCRNTAPLVTLAYQLWGAGIGCQVLGKDIGAALLALVKKLQGKRKQPLTLQALEKKLEAYREREVAKWDAKGDTGKVEAIQDKCEALQALIDALPESSRTLSGLIENLTNLFTDSEKKGLLTLATVHKSKGLEWPRVFVLDPFRMPSKYARQAWQQEQERNLQYIAITRAQVDLIYVNLADITR